MGKGSGTAGGKTKLVHRTKAASRSFNAFESSNTWGAPF